MRRISPTPSYQCEFTNNYSNVALDLQARQSWGIPEVFVAGKRLRQIRSTPLVCLYCIECIDGWIVLTGSKCNICICDSIQEQQLALMCDTLILLPKYRFCTFLKLRIEVTFKQTLNSHLVNPCRFIAFAKKVVLYSLHWEFRL